MVYDPDLPPEYQPDPEPECSEKAVVKLVPEMPECSDRYKAKHHGGTRPASQIRLVVLHSTEGDTAEGAAGWFANDASAGSAHIVVDDNACFRTLHDDVIPWGAQGDRANEDGLHLEMAGFAKRSRDEWLAHRETLRKGAAVVANWANKYGVPLKFLNDVDLRRMGNSARGVTTHAAITRAFSIAGGHTDPGVGFPLDVFFDLAGGEVPPSGGGGIV